MPDNKELVAIFEYILMLIHEGQIDAAIEQIISRQSPRPQIYLLDRLTALIEDLASNITNLSNRLSYGTNFSDVRAFTNEFNSDVRAFTNELSRDLNSIRAYNRVLDAVLTYNLNNNLGFDRFIIRIFQDMQVELRRLDAALDRTDGRILEYSKTNDLTTDLEGIYARAKELVDDNNRSLSDLRQLEDAFKQVVKKILGLMRTTSLTDRDEIGHVASRLRQSLGDAVYHLPTFGNTYDFPSTEIQANSVEFTAFYPRKIPIEQRAGIFIYIHLENSLESVRRNISRFREELGGEVPLPKTAKANISLMLGTMVTIVPECDELEFNPPLLTKRWELDWIRYEFDFVARETLAGETAVVNISIQVKGIEIASIKKCAIDFIGKKFADDVNDALELKTVLAPDTMPLSHNRLVQAKANFEARMASQKVSPYQKIFVSYSRKDTEIIRAYKAAQDAVGNDVFMDTERIHTGEDWMARLALEIDTADIFQLFWSENSANSEFVREEWEYALLSKCPEDKCVEFIRPVYWTSDRPNPEPPKQLGHLHFRYVDFWRQ